VGYFYQLGMIVPADFARAVDWYRKAAARGNAFACNQLGYLYHEGKGVPQDYVEALRWYYKAAEGGNADAQSNIGYAYQHGEGIEQDFAQALVWYRQAADQGNRTAENQLGWMYQFGIGVAPDYGEALAWYRLATDHGSKQGKENLAALSAKLHSAAEALWHTANASAQQEASAQEEWRAQIGDLRSRIALLESDAQDEDRQALALEQPNHARGVVLTNTPGSTDGTYLRLDAQKSREAAAQLRQNLGDLYALSGARAPQAPLSAADRPQD
jgi:TPR repeat protein